MFIVLDSDETSRVAYVIGVVAIVDRLLRSGCIELRFNVHISNRQDSIFRPI